MKRVVSTIVALDFGKLTLRYCESNENGLNLVDHHEGRLAVRLDQIALTNKKAAGTSGNRRANRRVADIYCRSRDGSAVGRDQGPRLRPGPRSCRGGRGGRLRLVCLGARHVSFLDERRVPRSIALSIRSHRFVSRQLRARLLERRYIRP